MGHIKRDCRKRQRDNQGKQSDGASFGLATTSTTEETTKQNELLCIFDSGASQHMVIQDVLTEARNQSLKVEVEEKLWTK